MTSDEYNRGFNDGRELVWSGEKGGIFATGREYISGLLDGVRAARAVRRPGFHMTGIREETE